MKQGDNASVAPFTITVTNTTPGLAPLKNLNLTPNVNWLNIFYSNTVGNNSYYTFTVNGNANILPLGAASAQIEVSADGALSKTIIVNNTITPGGPNLALNKPITASSIEHAGTIATYANDGKLNTRWASAYADGESIVIDLQAS